MKVLNIDEVEGEKLGESAIRRILVYSKNLMLMYSEAEPEGPPLAHSHPHEQLEYIIHYPESKLSTNLIDDFIRY